MKIGDKVRVRSDKDMNGSGGRVSPGSEGVVISVHKDASNVNREFVKLDTTGDVGIWSSEVNLITVEGVSMLKTVGSDMKAFIAEHKSTIYWIAVLFLVDHVFFQGAFRERLHGMMNKFLGKVEAQIEGKPVTLVPEKQA